MGKNISLEDVKFLELSDGKRVELIGTSRVIKHVSNKLGFPGVKYIARAPSKAYDESLDVLDSGESVAALYVRYID